MGMRLAISAPQQGSTRLSFTGLNFTGLSFTGLSAVAAAVLVVGLTTNEATAQTVAQPRGSLTTVDINVSELPTVQEEVLDVYFTQDKNFFTNHQFPRTLWPIIGIIENDIGGDGRHVFNLYRELLAQQTAGVPVRVADLPNPFTGSLGTTPLYVEEPIPPAPVPSFVPPPRGTVAPPAPGEPRESIPALW